MTQAVSRHNSGRLLLTFFGVVAVISYPMVVYLGLTRVGTRSAAVLLLVLSLLSTLWQSYRQRAFAWRSALLIPLSTCALWLDDQRYMLAMPVLINLALFTTFFGSLYSALPICERFARLQVTDLSPAERRYCRSITKLWSGFFVVNGGIAAGLAAWGALSLWTVYTGLISYLLIGLVAGTEYTVRKLRFGRFGDGLLDRMLQVLATATAPARSTRPSV